MTEQKIIPHLWFDKEAKEAAEFYASTFGKGSKVTGLTTLHDTPSGDCDVVSFELRGHRFMAISAGPFFTLNPAVSFIVNCETREEVDDLWSKLAEEGEALMPLDTYPFSERYGWIQDRFGVSWQLILSSAEGEKRPNIVPSLMFVGDNAGRAEEAIGHYRSVFKDAQVGQIYRYGAGQEPDQEGTVMFADFTLQGQWFAAMDSAREHEFDFNEAISFMVHCDTQEEIDRLWEQLSAVPEAEQCGWLKDRFGLSWQIVPIQLDAMMRDSDQKKVDRVTQAFLKMKKLDVAALKRAYEGA